MAQRGVFFLVGLCDQVTAVNQHSAVTFKPLLLTQTRRQLFDFCLVAGNQQQADFAPPAQAVTCVKVLFQRGIKGFAPGGPGGLPHRRC